MLASNTDTDLLSILTLVSVHGLQAAAMSLDMPLAEVARLYGRALIDPSIPTGMKSIAFKRIDRATR